MLSIKKGMIRCFALPLRQFFLFVTKITIVLLCLLFALYRGISNHHTRVLNQLQELIKRQKSNFQEMIEQKKLKNEQEVAALCTDILRLNMKKRQQSLSEFHHYAETMGLSILSYQGEMMQKIQERKKELQSYSFQGTLHALMHFLESLVQKQYPLHCIVLKILRQQDNRYTLHMTLKKYIDYETKPLQPVQQAEGLGGE